MVAAILSPLMFSEQEDGCLRKMCTHSLTAKRWQNVVPYFSQVLTNVSMNLCSISDQTLFFQYSNVCQVSVFNISLGTWQRPRFSASPSGPGNR